MWLKLWIWTWIEHLCVFPSSPGFCSCRSFTLNCSITAHSVPKRIIQLPFYPQAMDKLWIVNQWRLIFGAEQGGDDSTEAWKKTDWAGSFPSLAGANQNENCSERPSMCSTHWRPWGKTWGKTHLRFASINSQTSTKCLPVSSRPSKAASSWLTHDVAEKQIRQRTAVGRKGYLFCMR